MYYIPNAAIEKMCRIGQNILLVFGAFHTTQHNCAHKFSAPNYAAGGVKKSEVNGTLKSTA